MSHTLKIVETSKGSASSYHALKNTGKNLSAAYESSHFFVKKGTVAVALSFE
jgi:hypothetical protein